MRIFLELDWFSGPSHLVQLRPRSIWLVSNIIRTGIKRQQGAEITLRDLFQLECYKYHKSRQKLLTVMAVWDFASIRSFRLLHGGAQRSH